MHRMPCRRHVPREIALSPAPCLPEVLDPAAEPLLPNIPHTHKRYMLHPLPPTLRHVLPYEPHACRSHAGEGYKDGSRPALDDHQGRRVPEHPCRHAPVVAAPRHRGKGTNRCPQGYVQTIRPARLAGQAIQRRAGDRGMRGGREEWPRTGEGAPPGITPGAATTNDVAALAKRTGRHAESYGAGLVGRYVEGFQDGFRRRTGRAAPDGPGLPLPGLRRRGRQVGRVLPRRGRSARVVTAQLIDDRGYCRACGRPLDEHDDQVCPATCTPGFAQRGRAPGPRHRDRQDFVDVLLPGADEWDTDCRGLTSKPISR